LIHELFQLGKLTHLKQLILVGSRFSSQAYISSSTFENLPGYAYCLSKTSLSLFAQILRKENHNFTVNIIHPGVLNTEMGNPDGNHPMHTCEVLFELIANDYFQKEYTGIVDISTSKIIDF
jgi:NAD(P)-dependent dehydrogenase (short-subunit alcohol dehydrogenase family)